ncbi:HCL359Cp [Eremothecium sinecaudum]|uniref:HCL359Cp n=1 Tax=Eremothecium sinecaudum TaxID=45286 RepID=A0A109UZ33_9SACH|nr:HCL359Cp [Eremothecium sinecaudum]AMD19792.1 HCL359Cp [Eremothecium sinecaudum]
MSADCSVNANPLAQLNKRAQQDKSLQHGSNFNLQQKNASSHFKSVSPKLTESKKLQLDQFLGGAQNDNKFVGPFINNGISGGGSMARSQMGYMTPSPASEIGSTKAVNGWTQEFSQQSSGTSSQLSPALSSASLSSQSPVGRSNYRSLGILRPMVRSHQQLQAAIRVSEPQTDDSITDAVWDEQFQELEKEVQKSLNITEQESETTYNAPEVDTQEDYEDKFQQIWEDLNERADDMDTREETTTNWNTSYQQLGGKSANAPYEFDSDNQYMDNPDAYKIGCILMENGAKLSEAALAFEAAVQQNPKHTDAWLKLGIVQTQNEKELCGINALEECLKLDPGNLTAMMTIAISYINEGYDVSAFTMLGKWLGQKYPDMVNQSIADNLNRQSLNRAVTEEFLKVVNSLPEIDPEVQLGLGILFYANDNFEKTIDCFKLALAVVPNDATMWNRLGASLANSNRPEEAIQAYHRALALKPTFVRARYNLAVSSMNIGCYKEAAEYLLTALSMHEVEGVSMHSAAAKNVPSSNILETLKRTFIAMGRRDLLDKVAPNMDLQEFRREFNF